MCWCWLNYHINICRNSFGLSKVYDEKFAENLPNYVWNGIYKYLWFQQNNQTKEPHCKQTHVPSFHSKNQRKCLVWHSTKQISVDQPHTLIIVGSDLLDTGKIWKWVLWLSGETYTNHTDQRNTGWCLIMTSGWKHLTTLINDCRCCPVFLLFWVALTLSLVSY